MTTYEAYESLSPYKPTAIELTNIGFNILYGAPLSWYDSGAGTADSIKGVFFTYDGEPVKDIPSSYTRAADNKEFKINVITTGTGALGIPQYRLDNGDFDTTTNPYANIPGSYSGNVFTVSNFNLDGKYEIRITKGTAVPYIGYFEAKPIFISDTSKIATVQPLVKQSLYCDIINGQLVLYGGHGYIFFSEFDNFEYFPNFYNLYAAKDSDDEVVSINYFRQYNAVFTKKKLLRMTGTFGSSDFGLYPLNDFIGCINPNTIKQVENTLYFMTNEGLYKLKTGYTGEGTENVEKIDIDIDGDFDPTQVSNCVVKGNEYIIFTNTGIFSDIPQKIPVIKYNFKLGAFIKHSYNFGFSSLFENKINNEILRNTYSLNLVVRTTYLGEQIEYPNEQQYKYTVLEYDKLNYYKDDDTYFNSKITTPKLFWGMPTNDKKFKKILVKSRNNGTEAVPIYVTATVDDIDVLTPEYYVIRIDNDDNYVYYEAEESPNGEFVIKEGSVLGDLVLGSDTLGSMRTQDLELTVNGKGKCISLTIEDKDNDQPFSISDIGFVFRQKKPKKDR